MVWTEGGNDKFLDGSRSTAGPSIDSSRLATVLTRQTKAAHKNRSAAGSWLFDRRERKVGRNERESFGDGTM